MGALSEAALMIGMERNSDIVTMASCSLDCTVIQRANLPASPQKPGVFALAGKDEKSGQISTGYLWRAAASMGRSAGFSPHCHGK